MSTDNSGIHRFSHCSLKCVNWDFWRLYALFFKWKYVLQYCDVIHPLNLLYCILRSFFHIKYILDGWNGIWHNLSCVAAFLTWWRILSDSYLKEIKYSYTTYDTPEHWISSIISNDQTLAVCTNQLIFIEKLLASCCLFENSTIKLHSHVDRKMFLINTMASNEYQDYKKLLALVIC